MKPILALAVLMLVPTGEPAAQGGRDRDAGSAARTDSLLATPNRKTPVPQDNLFATTPGLTQQAPTTPMPPERRDAPSPTAK